MFALHPLLFPYRGRKKWDLSFTGRTSQADFTDWKSFLPSKLMEEVSSNTEALKSDTYTYSSAWKRFKYKCFNTAKYIGDLYRR